MLASGRLLRQAIADAIAGGAQFSLSMFTQPIDLLAAAAIYDFAPTFPGVVFSAITVRWIIESVDAAATTAVGGNLGNNAGRTNVILNTANFMSTAQLGNAFTSGAPWLGITAQNTTTPTMVDAAAPFQFQVTTPAAGAGLTVLRGRLILSGVPVVL